MVGYDRNGGSPVTAMSQALPKICLVRAGDPPVERCPGLTATRTSSPPRPGEREQKRALFKCFDVMGHALIECEQTAGAKTERPL